MPESPGSAPFKELKALQRQLIRGGVTPAMITRTMGELYDHHEDLKAEALGSGYSEAEASAEATGKLGTRQVLASEVLRHPEFKSWAFRWPWVPALLRQFVIVTSLAAVPVLVVVSRGPLIVRWCVSTGLAMLVTGSLLLLLSRILLGRLPLLFFDA